MKKMSRAFRERPLSPIDLGTFWVEFVLRNGDTSMMKPGSAELNWFQRHMLDISLPICTLILLLFSVTSYLCIHLVVVIVSNLRKKFGNALCNVVAYERKNL